MHIIINLFLIGFFICAAIFVFQFGITVFFMVGALVVTGIVWVAKAIASPFRRKSYVHPSYDPNRIYLDESIPVENGDE